MTYCLNLNLEIFENTSGEFTKLLTCYVRALNAKDNHEILMCVDELEITISIDNRGINPVLKSQSEYYFIIAMKT